METDNNDVSVQRNWAPRPHTFRLLILSDPRSGSSLLSSYLRCHERIFLHGELLNDEITGLSNESAALLQELDEEMSMCWPGSVEGFKLHLVQLFGRGLEPFELIRRLNIGVVIIIWRRSLLDSFVSLKIAEATDCWYTETEEKINRSIKIHVDEVEFGEYCVKLRSQWQKTIEAIAGRVPCHLIEYTDLVKQPDESLKTIFQTCGLSNVAVSTTMIKQNPTDPSAKISNWHSLSEDTKNAQLQVNKLFEEEHARHALKSDPWWPEPEPKPDSGVWTYRVAEPFIASESVTNVFKSMALRAISSAATPVAEMACELRRLYNVPVAQPCANGFVSLLLAMQAANIGKELNECVLVPSFTMIAVPNAVLYVGAMPVFVDNSFEKYNPGVDEYEEAARHVPQNYKIKAIIVTHTYSVPADIEPLRDMCLRNKWLLIEDISEAIGVSVNGQLLGTFGMYAGASLYANKTITAGDGGFVLSKDPSVAARLVSIVNHGFTPRYHFVHFEPCINGKINGLGAALVTPAIQQIDQVIYHRSCIARWYRQGLESVNNHVKCMPLAGDADGPWVFGIECQSRVERDHLRHYLAHEHGIETRNYFPPLDLEAAFTHLPEFTRRPCSQTIRLAEIGFYLPTHYWLTDVDVSNICQAIIAFYKNLIGWKLPQKTTPFPPLPVAIMVNDRTGRLDAYGGTSVANRQALIDAVHGLHALHNFFSIHRECWSNCKDMEDWLHLLSNGSGLNEELRNSFTYYAQYLNKMRLQNHLLSIPIYRSPWLDFKLLETNIRTTTPTEVQQLLCWLAVEYECHSVVELGPWLGSSTVQIIHAIRQHDELPIHYVALDGFRWQQWMNNRGEPWQHRAAGRSFLAEFQANINQLVKKDENTIVIPIQLTYDTSKWSKLSNIFTKPIDLIYVDISDNEDELEKLWNSLRHQLIPNKTVIVIQTYGVAQGVCKFVEQHFADFKPLYKPAEFAKAFLFVDKEANEITNKTLTSVASKKLNFVDSPSDWNHHRAGGFCTVIEKAKQQLHHHRAPTLFIPAVEQYFFENENGMNKPWIGIMHQVPTCNTVWMPDIERLLHSPQFLSSLNYCQGLYTLSTYLRDYIQKRLPSHLVKTVPVSRLFYPLSNVIATPTTMNVRSLIVMIGGYMRDLNDFFNLVVPQSFEKILLLNEMCDFDENIIRTRAADHNIKVLDRLSDNEYEQLLLKSIPFLSLKSDGIASTLVIECIWSGTPLLVRRYTSLEEYLGHDYPFFFDSLEEATNLLNFDMKNNNQLQLKAMDYLTKMHKDHLTCEAFIHSIVTSASYLTLSESPHVESNRVDLTVCICSYHRTDDLHRVLQAILNEQDFGGTFEVILWNNSFDRRSEVERICGLFNKPIRLIHSSENYYCIIRMCVLHLMNSEWLLVVDDDMICGKHFLSTFTERRNILGSRAILCLHGHKFLPHTLNTEDPINGGWSPGVNVRFIDDHHPCDTVHFAHADGCLFPKQALHDASTIEMSIREFLLVDDYWLSFVLNHYFGYKLCKITATDIYTKTTSSDDPSVALYLNPKVRQARMKLYVHHMLKGWPHFNIPNSIAISHTIKTSIWQSPFIGFNVPMDLRVSDMRDLEQMNVRVVRLGAVCMTLEEESNDNNISDLAFLLPQCMGRILPESLQRLVSYIDLFGQHGIQVILTLHRHLASPQVWQQVAAILGKINNVIGYDLINEPHTMLDRQLSTEDLSSSDHSSEINDLLKYYGEMLDVIRREDHYTPVIIEPSFWANWRALSLLKLEQSSLSLYMHDEDLFKISFHMYEPRLLTTHRFNKDRFSYPGKVPNYDGTYSLVEEWNSVHLSKLFDDINQIVTHILGLNSKKQMFIGELGISRTVVGAATYLQDVLNECHKQGWSSCLYSFREYHWNMMNYELGINKDNEHIKSIDNPLMKVITEAIQKTK